MNIYVLFVLMQKEPKKSRAKYASAHMPGHPRIWLGPSRRHGIKFCEMNHRENSLCLIDKISAEIAEGISRGAKYMRMTIHSAPLNFTSVFPLR